MRLKKPVILRIGPFSHLRHLSPFGRVLRASLTSWMENGAPSRAAAVAFYSILSLAPVLLIAVSVASSVIGGTEARSVIERQLTDWSGPDVAYTVLSVFDAAREQGAAERNTILGIAGAFLSTTVLFSEVQSALNVIWRVRSGLQWTNLIIPRLLSFLVVSAIGVMILVSVTFGTVLAAAGRFLERYTGSTEMLMQGADWIASLLLMMLMFSVIYKVLPDATMTWRDTWVGSAITAALFMLGRWAIVSYLSTSGVSSVYGASGSLALLLLWVYYSSQVFFLGAEFTVTYARLRGSGIRPRRHAILVPAGRTVETKPSPVAK